MKRCLYCYQLLEESETDFHASCSKKFFGKPKPPLLPYTEAEMEELATQIIRSRITVTGVQPKLSLDIIKGETKSEAERLTIVGLWGGYILKPTTTTYPQLPEVEDLTLHLARIAGIETVPHSLIRLQSGNLAYITKRIDRVKKMKLHMEDMCQLTERMTEDKYHGSYEQIGKTILKYSVNPGLDLVNFFEQVLFSFLTGNADMHLKNFSLIDKPQLGYTLTPAYDMVSTVLVVPDDKEEMALTLNGRKRKIERRDFIAAFNALKITDKVQDNLFKKFEAAIPKWNDMIDISFLTDEMKNNYKELITQKNQQLTTKQ